MFVHGVVLGDTRMDTPAFSPGHTICDTLGEMTAFFFFGQEKNPAPLFASSCSQLPTAEQENVARISSESSR